MTFFVNMIGQSVLASFLDKIDTSSYLCYTSHEVAMKGRRFSRQVRLSKAAIWGAGTCPCEKIEDLMAKEQQKENDILKA